MGFGVGGGVTGGVGGGVLSVVARNNGSIDLFLSFVATANITHKINPNPTHFFRRSFICFRYLLRLSSS